MITAGRRFSQCMRPCSPRIKPIRKHSIPPNTRSRLVCSRGCISLLRECFFMRSEPATHPMSARISARHPSRGYSPVSPPRWSQPRAIMPQVPVKSPKICSPAGLGSPAKKYPAAIMRMGVALLRTAATDDGIWVCPRPTKPEATATMGSP